MKLKALLELYQQRYIRLQTADYRVLTFDRDEKAQRHVLQRDFSEMEIQRIEAEVDLIDGEQVTMLYITL